MPPPLHSLEGPGPPLWWQQSGQEGKPHAGGCATTGRSQCFLWGLLDDVHGPQSLHLKGRWQTGAFPSLMVKQLKVAMQEGWNRWALFLSQCF